MTPFARATRTPESLERIRTEYLAHYRATPGWGREVTGKDLNEEEFATVLNQLIGDELMNQLYRNDTYQVSVRPVPQEDNTWPEMIHLSIRRIDNESIHDWRDLQRIKNELVGPENEGMELYPAESRVVDTANQYHIFVLKDKTSRFPIGWKTRSVTADELAGSKQRQFTPPTPCQKPVTP